MLNSRAVVRKRWAAATMFLSAGPGPNPEAGEPTPRRCAQVPREHLTREHRHRCHSPPPQIPCSLRSPISSARFLARCSAGVGAPRFGVLACSIGFGFIACHPQSGRGVFDVQLNHETPRSHRAVSGLRGEVPAAIRSALTKVGHSATSGENSRSVVRRRISSARLRELA